VINAPTRLALGVTLAGFHEAACSLFAVVPWVIFGVRLSVLRIGQADSVLTGVACIATAAFITCVVFAARNQGANSNNYAQ
jgi:hypothetical protein